MENILLPERVNVEPGSRPHESIISIQPCHPGFGTTLGNALRRVLLSSLPGAAVTSLKAKGAPHEFTTLPGVKDDIVELCLNLKQLRLKVFSNEPVELMLKASGQREVTAADIEPNSNVEIMNPDLVIATLTDKKAELDLKLTVERGRGYLTTESREGQPLEVGAIAIDAIFTPIRNVGFHIENVRVGQMTNFENVIMTIETDGTMTAQEALAQATAVLIDHFTFIQRNTGGAVEMTTDEAGSTNGDQSAAPEAGEATETSEEEKPKKARRKKAA